MLLLAVLGVTTVFYEPIAAIINGAPSTSSSAPEGTDERIPTAHAR
jgi:hypothetical protein